MTDEELAKSFEDGLRKLDTEEVRNFLSAKHFGVCADCGKHIYICGGRRRRCSECQTKRTKQMQKAFNKAYNKKAFKSTGYQKIVGRSVGR